MKAKEKTMTYYVCLNWDKIKSQESWRIIHFNNKQLKTINPDEISICIQEQIYNMPYKEEK